MQAVSSGCVRPCGRLRAIRAIAAAATAICSLIACSQPDHHSPSDAAALVGAATTGAGTDANPAGFAIRSPGKHDDRQPDRVFVELPSVRGQVDAPGLDCALDRRHDELVRCYGRARSAPGASDGTATAEFSLSPTGFPAKLVINGFGNRELDACVAGVIRSTDFPRPRGREAPRVSWRIHFGVQAEAAAPRGDLDKNAVRRTIRAKFPEVQACYEHAPLVYPQGMSPMHLTVDAGDGSLLRACAGYIQGPVTDCLENAFRTIRFAPGSRDGIVDISYPFTGH